MQSRDVETGKGQTCHGEMGGAVARLVAQGPDDDARLVLVALDHADSPVDDGVQPEGVAGRHDRVVAQSRVKAVRLKIGLVQQVDAVLVAQLVPALDICIN